MQSDRPHSDSPLERPQAPGLADPEPVRVDPASPASTATSASGGSTSASPDPAAPAPAPAPASASAAAAVGVEPVPAEAHDVDGASPAAESGADPGGAPDVAQLDVAQLEADIAAVGSALETVDRIVADVESGKGSVHSAAGEVASVVSPARFADL